MIRTDKESSHSMATAGGVAIIIPKNWSCTQQNVTTKSDNLEAISAILVPPDQNIPPLKIMCIYNHPGHYLPHSIISEFKNTTFNGKSVKGFLLGDLNCPHAAFGSRTTNEFGNRLLQQLNQEELIYLDAQSPTYLSNATGLHNVLDLIIVDAPTCQLVESCYVEGDVGSDHLPIITTLSLKMNTQTIQKTDIASWVQAVDLALNDYIATDDINRNISTITQIIQQTKESSTKTYKVKHKKTLPREILNNIRLRKTLMKKRKAATSDLSKIVITKAYNRINHKIKQQLQDFEDNKMQELCENICNSKDANTMWKIFNKYKNQNQTIDEPEAPLTTPAGTSTSNDQEKCVEFARYLSTIHQTPDDPLFDTNFKKEIDGLFPNKDQEIDNSSIPPIHITKFNTLLSDTKSHSAPGNDGISYELLKRCSNPSKQVFCDLINQCLNKNTFPIAWKQAKVRMLPKPGRDRKQASNYRPISLLSCVGKLYERYIYAYLIKELNNKNYLNKFQAGFTKGRSTQEHLFRLAQQVYNGFKRRDCTLTLLLDVKAAFDAVWKNGLKYKINQIGLSKQIENILHSFLDSRTLKVCTNGIWSDVVELKAGTPQGSCISPILYLIFVNDLATVPDLSSVSLSQFADDIGLWATCSKAKDAQARIQSEINKIEKWCRKWHITLSPIKSKLVLFTKCPRHKEETSNDFSIDLFEEKINLANEAEFLGVIFDSRLTWEPHVRKIVSRSYKRLNLLRAIAGISKKVNPDSMKKLYESTIRSIHEYSSVCIVNAADVHLQKLQLLQNQALRVILKTPAYMSISDLHDCSGLPMIKDHLIECARKRLTQMERSSPIMKETFDEYNNVRYIKENPSVLDIVASTNKAT